MNKTTYGLMAMLALALVPAAGQAQNGYPNRPVKVIVPFAPGGASDFVARIMQNRLGEILGQSIVVENRAGAAGNIGVEAAAKSAPDGYTLFLGNIGSIAINPAVFTKLAVNPLKDLVAITSVVDVPSVLVVNPNIVPKSLDELVAYARANPGKLDFASPGSGSVDRLAMELFKRTAAIDMVHVPYKGGAGPAATGLLAGETSLMFCTLPSVIGFIQGGRLRVLATASAKRLDSLPAVPTMAESGYADLVVSSWQGVFVPAGTPKDIVDRLYAAVQQTFQTPDVVERLAKGGVGVSLSPSPQAFAEYIAAESQRWARIARESKATVD
jgi:tripartite-type tricarboxylate transporter receptor subunit TctC